MKELKTEKTVDKKRVYQKSKKRLFKPGNMLYPLPVVMVSLRGKDGRDNIITIAWVGTVCTNPPMVSISVRPSRYSYGLLKETGEFVINLVSEKLVPMADACGVLSGRDMDKFDHLKLTREKADQVAAPMIAESPVSIECRVKQEIPLGSHSLFLAEVLSVHVDEALMDDKDRLNLSSKALAVYSHGEYLLTGKKVGKFGYSVKKKKKKT